MPDNRSGAIGESAAAEYLKRHGYRILQRNFRCRLGEIDIIATDGTYLAFVEVKTRKNKLYGEPREFVDSRKQKKIIAAAGFYLSVRPTALQPSFDVIEVYLDEGGIREINHLTGAFDVG